MTRIVDSDCHKIPEVILNMNFIVWPDHMEKPNTMFAFTNYGRILEYSKDLNWELSDYNGRLPERK